MYISVLLGIVSAVAAFVWYCRSSDLPPNDDSRQMSFRKNKPGDRCLICLKEMTVSSMRIMHCGHALCQNPCYNEYREWRRVCPYCYKLVIRITLPGDNCCVCLDTMTVQNIIYMKCEHALHLKCFLSCLQSRVDRCPICRQQM